MPRRPATSSAVAVALALAFGAVARGDGEAQDPLVAQVDALEKAAGASPAQATRICADAARLKALANGKEDLCTRLDAVVAAAKKSLKDAADKAFESTSQTVEKALASSDDPASASKLLDEALGALDRFDPALAEPKLKELDDLRRKVIERRAVARQAKDIFDKLDRMLAVDGYARGLGLLRAFEIVPELKASPWKSRADQLAQDVEKKRSAAAAKPEDDGWDVIFGGGSLQNLDLEQGDLWQTPQEDDKSDRVVAHCENENDSTETKAWFGDAATWGDLDCELEFYIGREGFELKLRDADDGVDRPQEGAILERMGYERTPALHRIRISLQGRKGSITRLDTFDTKTFELGRDKGRIAMVFPAKALVEFRKIRVRLADPNAKHFPKDEAIKAKAKEDPKDKKKKKKGDKGEAKKEPEKDKDKDGDADKPKGDGEKAGGSKKKKGDDEGDD